MWCVPCCVSDCDYVSGAPWSAEEILLENVELILEAFDYLQLPFALKNGIDFFNPTGLIFLSYNHCLVVNF